MDRYLPLLILFVLVLQGCGRTGELGPEPMPEDYMESLEEWKAYRVGVLKEPTGWLRLIDLIWLEQGENRFGSSPEMDVRFSEGTLPEEAGSFYLSDGRVTMTVHEGVPITHQGELVREMVLREGDHRPEVKFENLTWFIDVRGDQYGVRIFDTEREKADAFTGFPFFEVNPEWHLLARFVTWEEERVIDLKNVLGDTVHRTSPGWIEFVAGGERYTMIVFETTNGLFLMFNDRTGGEETFQAGRYLILDSPKENGHVTLDFNRAYNPPCAFNRFTTCHLPPPQNRLDIEIRAGEKRPVEWDGLYQ